VPRKSTQTPAKGTPRTDPDKGRRKDLIPIGILNPDYPDKLPTCLCSKACRLPAIYIMLRS